jgi:hypothetical protein
VNPMGDLLMATPAVSDGAMFVSHRALPVCHRHPCCPLKLSSPALRHPRVALVLAVEQ